MIEENMLSLELQRGLAGLDDRTFDPWGLRGLELEPDMILV